MPIQLPQQQFNVNRAGPALAEQRQGGTPQLAQQQLALQERTAGQQFELQQQQQALAGKQLAQERTLTEAKMRHDTELQNLISGTASEANSSAERMNTARLEAAGLDRTVAQQQADTGRVTAEAMAAQATAQTAAITATQDDEIVGQLGAVVRDMVVAAKTQANGKIQALYNTKKLDADKAYTNTVLRVKDVSEPLKRSAYLGIDEVKLRKEAAAAARDEFNKSIALQRETEVAFDLLVEKDTKFNWTEENKAAAREYYVKAKVKELADKKYAEMVAATTLAGQSKSAIVQEMNSLNEKQFDDKGNLRTTRDKLVTSLERTYGGLLSPTEKSVLTQAIKIQGQIAQAGGISDETMIFFNDAASKMGPEGRARVLTVLGSVAAASSTEAPEVTSILLDTKNILTADSKLSDPEWQKANTILNNTVPAAFAASLPTVLANALGMGTIDYGVLDTFQKERAADIIKIRTMLRNPAQRAEALGMFQSFLKRDEAIRTFATAIDALIAKGNAARPEDIVMQTIATPQGAGTQTPTPPETPAFPTTAPAPK
jgi:hypothetical protein